MINIDKTHVTITLLLLILPLLASGQGNWKFSGFSLKHTTWGSNYFKDYQSRYSETWEDLGGLFAKKLDNNSLSYYYGSSYFGYYGSYSNTNTQYDFSINLTPTQTVLGIKPNNQSLNIGLGYTGAVRQRFIFSSSDSKRYDTLSSDLGPMYADSVTQESLNYFSHFSKLSLNLSYRLSTDPLSRFHMYIAPTLAADLYIDKSIRAEYRKNIYPEYSLDDYTVNYNSNHMEEAEYTESENVRLDNSLAMSAHLPVGIAWRLSKTDKLLKKAYLFVEGKMGLDYHLLNDQRNVLDGIHGLSFGVRIWGLHLDD